MMPLITLTTDFGTQDGYIGAMKGRLLSRCPTATVVDISHTIPPQSILVAAWCIARAVPHFPPNTIHIVVVDPQVGSERSALLVHTVQDQWLLAPDNGVLSVLLTLQPAVQIYRLHETTEWWQKHHCFDGLEVFTPAAACLANGVAVSQLGKAISNIQNLSFANGRYEDNKIIGEIMVFDRFGNAITNIPALQLPSPLPADIYVRLVANEKHNALTVKLVNHYVEGNLHPATAIINSDGLLEIAVCCGSAQQQFSLQVGEIVVCYWG